MDCTRKFKFTTFIIPVFVASPAKACYHIGTMSAKAGVIMLRAILFDLDGVLTLDKTGSQSTLRSLSQHTDISYDALRTAYGRRNREMLLGEVTHADIWPDMCRELGQEIDYTLLHTAFIETPLDPDMLSLARRLKNDGCRIALVTDNKADRVHAILRHHSLYPLFDAVSISAELGSTKADSAIFQHTLRQLALRPEECLFIDNTSRNLLVPAAMGMHTCLFNDDNRDYSAILAALHQLTSKERFL